MITNDLEVSVAARRATAPPEAGDSPPAVSVRGLRKSYDGVTQALDGVDLDVRRGEVLAILGPNGAGKTTLVEILEGHRTADAGEVRVLGYDPAKRERAFRARIGIVLQEEGIDQTLSVREVVDLYSAAYPHPRPAMEVLELVGLGDRPDVRVSALSGGQRRRLDLALGIAGDPELVFLDEPTTGFDPSARRQSWELISALRDLGKTILLTTHYMDEAQHLADRVVVIARGKVIAGGAALDRPGYFIPPTIVRDIPDDARLVREEQFGPVLPVMRYSDLEDAIARANDSEFGLCGSVWGRDGARAQAVARRMNSGTVWVNKTLDINPNYPFRGAKQSGIGAELGRAGLEEYTQAKVINIAAG